MLRTIPVDPNTFTVFLLLGVEPKKIYGSTDQKTDENGTPMWIVLTLGLYPDGAETMKITVAALSIDTLRQVAPGTSVTVHGLRVGAYVAGKNAAWYWAADRVDRVHTAPTLPPKKRGAE